MTEHREYFPPHIGSSSVLGMEASAMRKCIFIMLCIITGTVLVSDLYYHLPWQLTLLWVCINSFVMLVFINLHLTMEDYNRNNQPIDVSRIRQLPTEMDPSATLDDDRRAVLEEQMTIMPGQFLRMARTRNWDARLSAGLVRERMCEQDPEWAEFFKQ